ncbi:DUF3823 domain-containing protein [Chitinophaga horti]|uniref:DUF3823 domain-containing protein n=1 Tax=Chitinophaga horti TaxID=2920382 RepID=A0ABY6IWK4_9BACT|nr:DUF3823 domain-containing protein [Chitinophaga horti]UYQ91746.1 DUF3823 domain-containing protein [Chitinophaga horti]
MKFRSSYILVLAIGTSLFSCKKDNYDPPSSSLTGRVVYQGEPIAVQHNQVSFELYQYGFGKVGPMGHTFAQDGTYSTLLFNGEYKLVIPAAQGPWVPKATSGKPDSINITVSGSQQLDIEVMPYYMVRTPQFTAAAGKVNATFRLEQIVTGTSAKAVENVALYVNKTQFVGEGVDYNDGIATIAGGAITDMNNIALSVNIPTYNVTQNYVYARVGIKIAGVEDRLFSQVVKVTY